MKFLIIVLFILFLTGCAAKVADNKPRVFGAFVSGITVQYVDEKGSTITNKKDKDDDEDCDSSCYLFHCDENIINFLSSGL